MLARGDMMVTEGEFRFRFPANDYYWTRLLDSKYEYEFEIDGFLRTMQDRAFVFVDLGANFGYWSARVAAGLYGRREVIAVEASSSSFEVLCQNLKSYKATASTFRYAVADRSGAEVMLFGDRHAGFSIDPHWRGASSRVADVVVTATLDDVLHEAGVDPSATPLVVKVDVEGAEKQVLCGATSTINGPSVFLMEDATQPGNVSDAIRYAHEHLGMRFYVRVGDSLRRLSDLYEIQDLKRRRSRVQQAGINLIATASAMWRNALDDLSGSE